MLHIYVYIYIYRYIYMLHRYVYIYIYICSDLKTNQPSSSIPCCNTCILVPLPNCYVLERKDM